MPVKTKKPKPSKRTTSSGHKHGDLRLWHIPQIPMKPFYVTVATLTEARLLYDVLADYDAFQFDNNIKPDYSNATGLSVFDANDTTDGVNGSWCDWYSDDGKELRDYTLEELRTSPPTWEGVL